MAKRTLGTTKNPKNVAVNLRMPVGMASAILDVIDKHPIEFSTAADYMRFCIKQDLIKRKMI